MDYLFDALQKRQRELNELVCLLSETSCKKELEKGRLRISCCRNKPQYFYCEKDGRERTTEHYISKQEIERVKEIAQNEYECKLLQETEYELKAVKKLIKVYHPNKLINLYEEMNPNRKNLVIPKIISDEQYVKEWEAVTYNGKEFMEYNPEIITDKGERVRSKSEKIIADFLLRNDIPYRYEYPLYLKGMGSIYPDFTILRKRDRKELYYEHFGMMDNAEYCYKAIYKIDMYARNGIVLGDLLYASFETSKRPVSKDILDKLVIAFR